MFGSDYSCYPQILWNYREIFFTRRYWAVSAADMTKPEQELLAKYLLQQLISPDHDPELDPIVARLTRADQCDDN